MSEERILELLAETLQRMDRRDAEIESIWERLELLDQKTDRTIELIDHQQDEINMLIAQMLKH